MGLPSLHLKKKKIDLYILHFPFLFFYFHFHAVLCYISTFIYNPRFYNGTVLGIIIYLIRVVPMCERDYTLATKQAFLAGLLLLGEQMLLMAVPRKSGQGMYPSLEGAALLKRGERLCFSNCFTMTGPSSSCSYYMYVHGSVAFWSGLIDACSNFQEVSNDIFTSLGLGYCNMEWTPSNNSSLEY